MSTRCRRIPAAIVAGLYLATCVASPATSLARVGAPGSRAHSSQKSKRKPKHLKAPAGSVRGPRGYPGAIGPRGPQGAPGRTGTNGTNGTNGTTGTALGYARVTAVGGVIASASKNITGANVTELPGFPGYFCFSGLPFTPETATATVAFAGSYTDAGVQVELASADPNFTADTGCHPGAQAMVFTHNAGALQAEPFYISFS